MKTPLQLDTDLYPEESYLLVLGQVHYYFSQLQWVAIHILIKLNGDDLRSTPIASKLIHEKLTSAIEKTAPSLSNELYSKLVELANKFDRAIRSSHRLIGTHPSAYPDQNKTQLQYGSSSVWSIDSLYVVANKNKDAAEEGSELFFGQLAAERPDIQ